MGGILATMAVCAAAQCPKTRELWEKGLDKGKQAKQKAMDAFGHMKDEASEWTADAKEKLSQTFGNKPDHA